MQDKDRDLSVYRLSLAEDTLANAKLCMDNQFYRDCINRSYYAAFYAIKAVLAIESIDFKRHKDAVGYFNKNYVTYLAPLWHRMIEPLPRCLWLHTVSTMESAS